ncbi:MAG: hypothetical protein HZC28_20295 [Spirochaetes bacterium]|nr:hypothetical protein [Spirochaetota bacterium]
MPLRIIAHILPLTLLLMFMTSCIPASREEALAKGGESMKKGFELYEQKEYSAAYRPLQKAYSSGIRTGTLLFRLGYCTEKEAGDRIAAKRFYEESLEYFKSHPEEDVETYMKAYYNFGSLYYYMVNRTTDVDKKKNFLMRAKKIWDEGLALHPSNSYIAKHYDKLEADIKRMDAGIE